MFFKKGKGRKGSKRKPEKEKSKQKQKKEKQKEEKQKKRERREERNGTREEKNKRKRGGRERKGEGREKGEKGKERGRKGRKRGGEEKKSGGKEEQTGKGGNKEREEGGKEHRKISSCYSLEQHYFKILWGPATYLTCGQLIPSLPRLDTAIPLRPRLLSHEPRHKLKINNSTASRGPSLPSWFGNTGTLRCPPSSTAISRLGVWSPFGSSANAAGTGGGTGPRKSFWVVS